MIIKITHLVWMGVCQPRLETHCHLSGYLAEKGTQVAPKKSQYQTPKNIGKFRKIDTCLGNFLQEMGPMLRDFLCKSSPLEWHIPLCLNMRVPRGWNITLIIHTHHFLLKKNLLDLVKNKTKSILFVIDFWPSFELIN